MTFPPFPFISKMKPARSDLGKFKPDLICFPRILFFDPHLWRVLPERERKGGGGEGGCWESRGWTEMGKGKEA